MDGRGVCVMRAAPQMLWTAGPTVGTNVPPSTAMTWRGGGRVRESVLPSLRGASVCCQKSLFTSVESLWQTRSVEIRRRPEI